MCTQGRRYSSPFPPPNSPCLRHGRGGVEGAWAATCRRTLETLLLPQGKRFAAVTLLCRLQPDHWECCVRWTNTPGELRGWLGMDLGTAVEQKTWSKRNYCYSRRWMMAPPFPIKILPRKINVHPPRAPPSNGQWSRLLAHGSGLSQRHWRSLAEGPRSSTACTGCALHSRSPKGASHRAGSVLGVRLDTCCWGKGLQAPFYWTLLQKIRTVRCYSAYSHVYINLQTPTHRAVSTLQILIFNVTNKLF